jgi:predicted HTH transcriptional regulator
LFEKPDGSTRTVLFAHKELKEMDKQERIRACYMHACLRYVTRKKMTNASLRERFGIESQNASEASRFLKEAIESGDILLQDASVGNRSRQYLPFWAGSTTGSP